MILYQVPPSGIVRTNGGKSDEFDINQGVKQGGVLSLALFNFFINDLIEECLNSGLGAMIGDLNVCIVAYYDDIILLSPTKAHMDRLLSICDNYSKKWRMSFNPKAPTYISYKGEA